MKVRISLFLGIVICLYVSSVHAADTTVIIPLLSSKKLANVITVSKNGGDFSDPVAAVKSIADASFDNQYLVFIGPGRFEITEPINMKEHVSLQGAGPDLTYLSGSLGTDLQSTSTLIVATEASKISDMTLTNKGALSSSTCSCIYGKYINIGAGVLVDNVSIWTNDCSPSRGIDLDKSSLFLSNLHINAVGAGSSGIYAKSTKFELNNSFVSSTGFNSFGIRTAGNLIPATLPEDFSVYNSRISGILSRGGAVDVYYSHLGEFTLEAGSIKCIYSHSFGTPLNSSCL